MIDHLGFSVSKLAPSTEFYLKALAPLGISIIMQVSAEQTGAGAAVGFGSAGKPFFWIGEGRTASGMHVCFAAQTRAQVDAFYKAANDAGAKDNGKPGIRAHYHPNYYGAFVIDLNGVNIEACCHAPG